VPPDIAKNPNVAAFPAQGSTPVPVQVTDDATLEFSAESSPATDRAVSKVRRLLAMLLAALLVLAALAGAWVMRSSFTAAATGAVRVESDPPGAEVRIDGEAQGTTPLTLSLPVGHHTLQVREGARAKELPVDVTSGTTNAYHIAWADDLTAVAAAPTGALSIAADQPGVVTVDGKDQGRTPLTITGLTPGQHDVVVRAGTTVSRRSVQIAGGATASLVISNAQASWGWVSLDTPIPIQVLEGGAVVGTSDVERILLSPGDHDLDLVAEPFGFRLAKRVRVTAGRQAPLEVTIPQVPMSINALPWADVFIDGVRVGETPLANVLQPIGDHEIVFRHPQLGEKRQAVRVVAQNTPRILVDMRAK